MNNLVALLFVLAVVSAKPLSDELKEKYGKIHEECSSTTNLAKEDIMTMYEEGSFDDPKLKEHIFCFTEKLGVINGDGEIQKDVLKEALSEYLDDDDKADEIVTKCAEEKDSALETAFALTVCIHQEKPEK